MSGNDDNNANDDWLVRCDAKHWLFGNLAFGILFGLLWYYFLQITRIFWGSHRNLRFKHRALYKTKEVLAQWQGILVEKSIFQIPIGDSGEYKLRHCIHVEYKLPPPTPRETSQGTAMPLESLNLADSHCCKVEASAATTSDGPQKTDLRGGNSEPREEEEEEETRMEEQQEKLLPVQSEKQQTKYLVTKEEYENAHVGQIVDLIYRPRRETSSMRLKKKNASRTTGLINNTLCLETVGMIIMYPFFAYPPFLAMGLYLPKRIQEGEDCKNSVWVCIISTMVVTLFLCRCCDPFQTNESSTTTRRGLSRVAPEDTTV